MPRRKTSRRKTSKKKGILKKRRRKQRPYKRDKRAHMHRRRKLHHGAALMREQEIHNYLLHQMLKTMSNPEGSWSHLPRHHTKNPEYASSDPRHQRFMRDVPAPDFHYWRAPGPSDSGTWTAAPYRGNIAA